MCFLFRINKHYQTLHQMVLHCQAPEGGVSRPGTSRGQQPRGGDSRRAGTLVRERRTTMVAKFRPKLVSRGNSVVGKWGRREEGAEICSSYRSWNRDVQSTSRARRQEENTVWWDCHLLEEIGGCWGSWYLLPNILSCSQFHLWIDIAFDSRNFSPR